MAVRSKKWRVLYFGKPFCVEDPITQAENGRNELCQLLARSKGVVPQPSPANAFGEHITDFSGTCGIVQMNFINSLEADVHSLRGQPPERVDVRLKRVYFINSLEADGHSLRGRPS